MKRLFYGAVVLAVILAACDTVEDVYDDIDTRQPRGIAIANGGDLAKIGVDADYPLNGDYYLADDIDLSAHSPWAPIGTEAAPFSGILDGNGKTIRGLVISGGSRVHTGLFGYLLAARLTNLTIEIKDTLAVMTTATAQYAGVAAGYAKASNIDGITLRAAAGAALYVIKAGYGSGTGVIFCAGGLAGKVEESTIRNISVNLPLKTASSIALYAGLIAGESAGGTLVSCFAEGTVDASASASGVYAGGIVGSHTNPLENCTSAVTRVSAESSSVISVYAGGIAGRSSNSAGNLGNIFTSSLKADHPVLIQGVSAGSVSAGGISGMVMGGSIDTCLVDAPITVSAESSGVTFTAAADGIYAGGIVGQVNNGSGIRNAYIRRGDVRARATSVTATGIVKLAAGGIAGGLFASGAKITGSFSAANVRVDSNLTAASSATTATAAGGVAGMLFMSTAIERCGASGTVEIVSTNPETGAVFAGGIAGYGMYSGTNGIALQQSAALNESVKAGAQTATPHAYRVLGGVPGADAAVAAELNAVTGIAAVDLFSNYALPDMQVQTGQGADSWGDVDQGKNNASNLMGSTNMERSQAFLESQLGWDFSTDWEWDAAAKLPFPRF